jgi:hypothetical protein
MTARHSLLRAGRRKQRTSTHAAANTHRSRSHTSVPCFYSIAATPSLAACAADTPARQPPVSQLPH